MKLGNPSFHFKVKDGSIIAALGGALSLYLGISIAMAFEVVEFLVDVVVNVYVYGCGKKSKSRRKSIKSEKAGAVSPTGSSTMDKKWMAPA